MPPILASNLVEKSVMTNDGKQLGELYNVTMDLKTGELSDFVVDPGGEIEHGDRYPIDGNGRYRVPADRIRGVSDYVTVT